MKNRKKNILRLIALFTLFVYVTLPLQAFALSIGEELKICDQLLFSIRK